MSFCTDKLNKLFSYVEIHLISIGYRGRHFALVGAKISAAELVFHVIFHQFIVQKYMPCKDPALPLMLLPVPSVTRMEW